MILPYPYSYCQYVVCRPTYEVKDFPRLMADADVQELASELLHAKNFDPNFGLIRGLRWEVIHFCEFCFILCFVLVFVVFFAEIK